jgi:hypothetical protein
MPRLSSNGVGRSRRASPGQDIWSRTAAVTSMTLFECGGMRLALASQRIRGATFAGPGSVQ